MAEPRVHGALNINNLSIPELLTSLDNLDVKFGKEENSEIAGKLRRAFAEWIDNGHNNFADENTIILCIQLTDGVLFSHGTRYDIDFTE